MPRSEVLAVLSLLMFSWSAWRNMTPGLILLAPVVAESLCLAFPLIARRPEPRWSKPAGVGLAVSLTALGLLSIPGRELLPLEQNPVDLAKGIAQLEPHQRVLNDYNVAGLALYFGGAETQVAIDGRADRYGAGYIESYLRLNNLQGDWKTLLAELAPTSALIKRDTALAQYLSETQHWTVVGTDGEYVLLKAPSR